jgi:uncharacterized membrane protein YidH (DUF202 family)
MTERHLIAYLLIAVMIGVAGFGIHRWRRAIHARRHPRKVGRL